MIRTRNRYFKTFHLRFVLKTKKSAMNKDDTTELFQFLSNATIILHRLAMPTSVQDFVHYFRVQSEHSSTSSTEHLSSCSKCLCQGSKGRASDLKKSLVDWLVHQDNQSETNVISCAIIITNLD